VKSEYSDSVSNLAIKLQTRYLRMGCQDRCFSPGVEVMISHIKRRGFSRIGCCGRYLGLSGMK
jgi:hypothetical protein